MINNALFLLVSINKGIFLKREVLNKNVFFWYLGRVIFASNFLISSWISIKILHEFSSENVLTTHKIFLC